MGNVISNNIYVYCFNSPTMYIDTFGDKSIRISIYDSDTDDVSNMDDHIRINGFYIDISTDLSLTMDPSMSFGHVEFGIICVHITTGNILDRNSTTSKGVSFSFDFKTLNMFAELENGISLKGALYSLDFNFSVADLLEINLNVYLGVGVTFEFSSTSVKIGYNGAELTIRWG